MSGIIVSNNVDKDLIKVNEFFNLAIEELKTQNRFSSERLDKVVDSLVNEKSNVITLKKGTILFRARKYTEADAEERFQNPDNNVFQGYDEEGSYANRNAPNEGRCNPAYIAYLYAAESIECCINEIGPHIGDIISVAEIRVNKSLKVLKLAKPFAQSSCSSSIIKNIPDCIVVLYLQNLFSKPRKNPWDYWLTQYIAEKIKNKGFDAISFFSSVYKGEGRTNFTVFNLDKCKEINSKLCKVSNIKVDCSFDPSNYEEDLEYWQSGKAFEDFIGAFD